MRKSHGTDFHVDVEWKRTPKDIENLGRFTFGRRTMRDVFLIRSEYNRLTNGNYSENGVPVDGGAWAIATLFVLMVEAPESFDLDKVDPLMDDTWEDKTAAVFTALRAKELGFRPNSGKEVQAASPPTSDKPSVGIPPKVQPGADGF
jgi:hypothetical protein